MGLVDRAIGLRGWDQQSKEVWSGLRQCLQSCIFFIDFWFFGFPHIILVVPQEGVQLRLKSSLRI